MRNNNTKITLALFVAIVTIMITFPVVYGYLICPANKKFLGITGLYPIEQFYYLSIGPSQAVKGHVLFSDKYGRLPDEDVLLNPIANIIGMISAFADVSLPVSFNIFRLFSSIILILSFYYLCKQFITSRQTLLISMIIYCFSGGFDFWFDFFQLSSIDAVDDSIPEANMFIAMCGEYYLPLANALFILALASAYGLFFKNEDTFLLCGFSLFLLGAVYVYGLVTAVAIISVNAFYRGYSQKQIRATVITLLKLALFCLPVTAYYLWLISRFPSIDDEGWFSLPSFLSLISTFGFGFLFSTLGFLLKDRKKNLSDSFLLIWVVITLLLIYLPQTILPIQIQMFIGLGAPLSILFATSLEAISKITLKKLTALSRKAQLVLVGTFVLGVIVVSSSTNIVFYTKQFSDLRKQILPWYIDARTNEAMEWSAKNISDKKLIITSRKLGFIFSSITACRVYTGISNFRQKTTEQSNTEKALNLFTKNNLEEAKQILSITEADYLFLDKSIAGADFHKLDEVLKTVYKKSFSNQEVSIFQLK